MRTCGGLGVLAVCLGLGACTSGDEMVTGRSAIQAVQGALAGPGPGDTFVTPTRAQLDEDPRAFVLAKVPARDVTGLLQFVAANGAVETWATADGITLSFRDGVLVQTRGFGADLMSAAVPSAASLARGAPDRARVHDYLGPEDRTTRLALQCSVVRVGGETVVIAGLRYALTRVEETCSGTDTAFTNLYWFDGASHLRQSAQWISPEIGNVLLFDLRR